MKITPLKKARIAMGLSQSTAAAMVGVGQAAWSRVERGIQRPRSEVLLLISAKFGISAEDLLGMYVVPVSTANCPVGSGAAIAVNTDLDEMSEDQAA
jgi:transcriptional regulator with XRE-family HTH domain